MTILSAQAIHLRFGEREILRRASLAIDARERVGMVGRNGSGKSTLAKILAGAREPDAGEVVRRAGLQVSYLAQEPAFEPGLTALEAVLAGLSRWTEALARHEAVTAELSRAGGDTAALVREQAQCAATVEELGGWDLRHEAASMLSNLGVPQHDSAVETMSGGERRRVALARVLVARPQLAILDEPTNHLDLSAIEWLERWICTRFTGAVLMVTHDRTLLDRVVSRTVEVEDGHVYSYDGGWGKYLEAKAIRLAHDERVETNRQRFVARELEWLRRSPQARTTKQKARVQRAAAALAQSGPRKDAHAQIEIDHVRSGRTILEAENVCVEVAGRTLVRDVTLRLSEGERLGIIGPNGCGKTSLLRVLTQQREPHAGHVKLGKNTQIAYLDQHRGNLSPTDTIYDAVAQGGSQIQLGKETLDIRTYLERFLFRSHEQRKRIETLSGGERARVALAKVLRAQANVVVLDEPTNDLDVDTLASLESALLGYPGTLLVVTHDRWFLDRVATGLLVFDNKTLELHRGGYSDWHARAAPATAPSASPSVPAPSRSRTTLKKSLTYAEELELEGLLERVDAAESKVSDMEAQAGTAAFYARPEREQRAFFEQLEHAKAEAEALANRWTELEERRDAPPPPTADQ